MDLSNVKDVFLYGAFVLYFIAGIRFCVFIQLQWERGSKPAVITFLLGVIIALTILVFTSDAGADGTTSAAIFWGAMVCLYAAAFGTDPVKKDDPPRITNLLKPKDDNTQESDFSHDSENKEPDEDKDKN